MQKHREKYETFTFRAVCYYVTKQGSFQHKYFNSSIFSCNSQTIQIVLTNCIYTVDLPCIGIGISLCLRVTFIMMLLSGKNIKHIIIYVLITSVSPCIAIRVLFSPFGCNRTLTQLPMLMQQGNYMFYHSNILILYRVVSNGIARCFLE